MGCLGISVRLGGPAGGISPRSPLTRRARVKTVGRREDGFWASPPWRATSRSGLISRCTGLFQHVLGQPPFNPAAWNGTGPLNLDFRLNNQFPPVSAYAAMKLVVTGGFHARKGCRPNNFGTAGSLRPPKKHGGLPGMSARKSFAFNGSVALLRMTLSGRSRRKGAKRTGVSPKFRAHSMQLMKTKKI